MANPESLKSEEERHADDLELAERLKKFDSALEAETIKGGPTDTPVMDLLHKKLRETIENEATTSERKRFYSEDDSSDAEGRHLGKTEYIIPENKRDLTKTERIQQEKEPK